METRTWAEVSARAGRNDLPALLIRNWHNIDPSDRTEAVTSAWMMAEWPEQTAPADIWTPLFEQIGFTVDGEPALRAEHLPENVTLYRGAIPARRRGMSWTTSIETATWFARRFDGMGEEEGHVYRVMLPRGAVLALVSGRGESEAVMVASALEDVGIADVTV